MKKFAIFAAVMVIGAGVALATTLTIPIFTDTASNPPNAGIAGFVTVKETANTDQVITVVYTALDQSGTPVDQTGTFFLGAKQQKIWQPVQATSLEGAGSTVPNMTIIGPSGNTNTTGSVAIQSSQANGIEGRYQQANYGRQTDLAHVALPK